MYIDRQEVDNRKNKQKKEQTHKKDHDITYKIVFKMGCKGLFKTI